jgi:hypothetical protein
MRHLVLPTAALLALPLLGACKEDGPPAVATADSCGAAALQGLVGTPVDQADLSAHAPLRVIPPGTAVTMDHRPDRLNVETDAGGVITRVFCG